MALMFAKVFTQIFDSSIAENYKVRHVFEDLLKLADKTGVVDITIEAVCRRTNVPLDEVSFAIQELLKPDLKSRSHLHEGRRLLPLDSHRSWGWIIVNYEYYRAIQDAESLRANWRDAKAKQRAKPKRKKYVPRDIKASERRYDAALSNEASENELDAIVTESLPAKCQ
jgi:hypothetical protein